MLYRFLLSLLALVLVFNPLNLTGLFPLEKAYAATEGDALWARSTVVGPSDSQFESIITDSTGNIYASGYIYGTGQYDFGNGVTVTGGYTTNNAVLVKYNSEGVAQWAKTVEVGPNKSILYDVAVDSSNNIYISGYIYGTGQFDFGNGVTVTGNSTGNNVLIVKYNSSGVTQWARSTILATITSVFSSINIDSWGNLYASGNVYGIGESDFGNSVTVQSNYTGASVLLAKYSSEGVIEWAKTVEVGPNRSQFYEEAIDSLGNIYAAGLIYGTGQYDFGNGVTATGKYTIYNSVVVKYNSLGVAQWAKTVEIGPDKTWFDSIIVDSSDNIYASGCMASTNQFDFGNGVTVTGGSTYNAIIVKYNTQGEAQWARSTVSAPDLSEFFRLASDSFGNLYAAGFIVGTGQYNFGNDVTVTGANSVGTYPYNIAIVKYSPEGIPQWARSTEIALNISALRDIAVDYLDNIYGSGYIYGNEQYDFGGGATVTGGYMAYNALLIKYTGPPPPEIIYQNLPDYAGPINLEEGEVVTTPFFTIRVKPHSEVGIAKVEFYVDDNLLCTSFTPDENGVYSCIWETAQNNSVITIIAYDTLGNTETLTRAISVSLAPATAELTVLPKTGR